MPRLKRYAMLLCLIYCAVSYFKLNVADLLPSITDSRTDFTHYYRAARSVLAAQSPYTDQEHYYPAIVAFLFTPLALTDYMTARWLWFWGSQALLLLAAVLTWRALGGGRTAACSVACVWALTGPAAESIVLGQIGPVVVLLLVLVYWGAAATQGAALAAGFCLKMLPGVLSMVVLLRRDWRAVAVAIAVAVPLVAVPAAVVAHWKSGPASPERADYLMGSPALMNWSIPGIALRIADPPVSPARVPHNWESGNLTEALHLPRGQRWLSAGIGAGVLLAGLAALLVVCRGRLGAAQVPWASAALISLAVAAVPVSWSHYQVFQYPGLALLLCHAVRQRKWLLGAGTVALGALLYRIPAEILFDYHARYAGWSAASPATLYIGTSVTPIAALLLFGVLLRQVANEASPADRAR
ncbi:MAG: glycosyltransferase 87 family protein [Bryobacteraceae bacterium]